MTGRPGWPTRRRGPRRRAARSPTPASSDPRGRRLGGGVHPVTADGPAGIFQAYEGGVDPLDDARLERDGAVIERRLQGVDGCGDDVGPLGDAVDAGQIRQGEHAGQAGGATELRIGRLEEIRGVIEPAEVERTRLPVGARIAQSEHGSVHRIEDAGQRGHRPGRGST